MPQEPISLHFCSARGSVTMGFLIVVCLIASICHGIQCNTVTSATDIDDTVTDLQENSIPKKEFTWKEFLFSQLKPEKISEIKKADNVDASKRRSRILGGLAFLAGLSLGGLASAASSSVKSIAKIPQASLTVNLSPSKLSPYYAYYDPYTPVVPHPYVYPYGLLPLLSPSKLHHLDGGAMVQNVLQPTQVVTLLDDKRPTDPSDNEEEYIDENKKAENDSTLNNAGEEGGDHAESRVETDRNAEEKLAIRVIACSTKSSSKERENLQENANNLWATLDFRQRGNATQHTNNQTVITDPPTTNNTMTVPMMANATQNTTGIGNATGYPYPFGYYGGRPMDIGQVHFTTESSVYGYRDYNQINYNLPYERPANFYPEEKYIFYPSAPSNGYSFSSYASEQIPDYLYAPDNPAAFGNGFRPL